ncbi:MAG TPA: enolase C-terminal domain-like protein [Streptosporangiaceae bacterium]
MPRVQGCDAFRVTMRRGGRPESILVRLTGDNGAVGWGEAPVRSHDAGPGEADGSIWADIEERLAPALLGVDWDRPEDVAGVAQLGGRGAAAAIDIACWDLWCRARRVPLAHALGGTRTAVVVGARITVQTSLESLVSRVNSFVGAGYARVTVAIRPGWDIEPIRAVRRAYPALALVADAGGGYTEAREHLAALSALDGYGLLAIERPFRADDLAAHARLQGRIATPLCPYVGDLEALDAAIGLDAGRALHLRIAPLGGLTAARSGHDRAYAAGWDVWCGEAGAFGIGQAAAIALAGLPGCTLPSDVAETGDGPAFVTPPVRASGGVMAVPFTQPGLGHTVNGPAVARLATQTVRIPA